MRTASPYQTIIVYPMIVLAESGTALRKCGGQWSSGTMQVEPCCHAGESMVTLRTECGVAGHRGQATVSLTKPAALLLIEQIKQALRLEI